MKEEGIVVRLNRDRKFCHIEREGKEDLHCSTRYLPDIEDGDRVEFEEQSTPQGPTARKVRILARADGSPYVRGQKIGTAEISVTAEFGELRITQIGKGKRSVRHRLPVWILVRNAGQPVVGKEVKLDYNGTPAVQLADSVRTLGDGKAFFPVILPTKEVSCHFVATVDGKSYGFYWDKDQIDAERKAAEDAANAKAQAEQAKKAAETPNDDWTIEVVAPDGPLQTGEFPVQVATQSNGKPKSTTVMVTLPRSIEVSHALAGPYESTGRNYLITLDEKGRAELFFRFVGAQITFDFQLGEQILQIDLVKPRYMVLAERQIQPETQHD